MTKPRYWITPPDLYYRLDAEFMFNFDPCPFPRSPDFDGIWRNWGSSNWVNPPFCRKDGYLGAGPSAFVGKAEREARKGNTSVLILPLRWATAKLIGSGAEVRFVPDVRWLEVETGEPSKKASPCLIGILGPGQAPGVPKVEF